MRIRSLFCLMAILIAWTPYSFAKKAPTPPLLISAQELGGLPEDKRALYLSEFLKFMQHLEEFQKKYGMDYASYFEFLLPVAEARTSNKCFYGMHIRTSVQGYCFHDKRSGDRDLTKNVSCKEPVRVINQQTKQYQTYQAVMECPRLLFEKSDGSVYCTKLGDGSSEGCINHLRGDNPKAPLQESEKFKELVKKFAACNKPAGAPAYCSDWNQYQKDFETICPGVTRGVRMLCGEITPFLSTLRTEVGLAKVEPPPEAKEVQKEETPKAPEPPTSIPIPPRPQPPAQPSAPQPPATAGIPIPKRPEPPVIKQGAPPIEQKQAPVPKVSAEVPKPPIPEPQPQNIKAAASKTVKAGVHSCANRAGGYPKYANNFACLLCPIEAQYESENPNYKVSDRYMSMLSVIQGFSCQGGGGAQRPMPQHTLELVNKWGYCSSDLYKWKSEPSAIVKKWNTSARTTDDSYRSLFTSKGKRMRSMREGHADTAPLTVAEKAFQEAYGIDFYTVSQMYCAKDEAEFEQLLTRTKNVEDGLAKCFKEAADKRRKIAASRGCYNFADWRGEDHGKLSTVQIDNLLKQKQVLRFEYNCGTQVKPEDQDKCEILEAGKDAETGADVINTLRPSQLNSAGGYLVGQAETISNVRSKMEGKAKACMYQFADLSQKNCAIAKTPAITVRELPSVSNTPATPAKQ